MTAALEAPGVALTAQELIALRGLARLREITTPPLSRLPGGFVSRKRGHGQEVADVREYVAGDDIRHLDRGATARTGSLHVRAFQEDRDRVTLLVADFRPSMLWGLSRAFRSVAAAEALAVLGWRVVEAGGRVGLLALSAGDPVAVPVRGRARGMLDVIGGMVRAHKAAVQAVVQGVRDDPPLDMGLERASRVAPTGAEVAIATGLDTPGAALDERLGALAQRAVPRLILVSDGVTRSLPRGSYPIRLPDGTRRRVDLREPPADGTEPGSKEQMGDVPVLRIDAGEDPARTARQIVTAFPADRVP